MTMATEETQSAQARPLRSNLLRKQSEIEEVDEEDTSPGSDQSDTTITAGKPTRFQFRVLIRPHSKICQSHITITVGISQSDGRSSHLQNQSYIIPDIWPFKFLQFQFLTLLWLVHQ